ncbi:CPBP family intramembrane glutamic endopeptidase [Halanaerobacter jeridensis]|uniref:Membrane protease YdiL (CAAX protease family) n=1 Tax=Halanaerobacter jeridensis TaxID=706427 RepID=A0A939BT63_9FIRM|nr:type II CAAX endopeptidase family protein [Halanaerobacter jeridensis]MBM7557901.1 membrane protease YdiL (CAAX protease family) [Halanaerobacter jeridensis]
MIDLFKIKDDLWNLGDILLISIIVFGGRIPIYQITKIIFSSSSLLILNFIVHLIQSLLLVCLTLSFVVFKYNHSLTFFGLKKIKPVKNINYGLLGGIFIWLLITLINNCIYVVTTEFFQCRPATQAAVKSLLSSENLFLFLVHSLLIVIIAPITEEIFFRGFIYLYCKNKVGIKWGIIISALVFGLAHFNFWIFLPTFSGGIILAWIYEQTDSLYPAMIAHGTWNGIIIVLLYILWGVG